MLHNHLTETNADEKNSPEALFRLRLACGKMFAEIVQFWCFRTSVPRTHAHTCAAPISESPSTLPCENFIISLHFQIGSATFNCLPRPVEKHRASLFSFSFYLKGSRFF